MEEFDKIDSLKNGTEKTTKLIEYYKETVKINEWLTNTFKTSIINFKDRIEYKKHNLYHRLNGPAIDFNDEKLDKYYYRGKLFETKNEWQKATIKEVRKIKIKKLNNNN
jgi:hypothetical protein